MVNRVITLSEFIIARQSDFLYATGELSRLLSAISLAAKIVNSKVNKAGLIDVLGSAHTKNIQNEDQQKLDIIANRRFIHALKAQGEVCGVASEEEESYTVLKNENGKKGKYIVLIDPMDGSSNIDVNVSIGTIFSIYRALDPDFGGYRGGLLTTGYPSSCIWIYCLWLLHNISPILRVMV